MKHVKTDKYWGELVATNKNMLSCKIVVLSHHMLRRALLGHTNGCCVCPLNEYLGMVFPKRKQYFVIVVEFQYQKVGVLFSCL